MAGYLAPVHTSKLFAANMSLGQTEISASGEELNKLDASLGEPAPGSWAGVTRWGLVRYDFAFMGGAQGDISLLVNFPDNAILVGGFCEVLSTFTSGGAATIGLRTEAAGDILTGGILGGFGAGAIVPCAAVGAVPFKQTAERTLILEVGAADLTGGSMNVWIEYFIGAF